MAWLGTTTMLLATSPVGATPWGVPTSRFKPCVAPPPAATPPDSTGSAPAATVDAGSVDAALREGDLPTARARAQRAREADPSAAHWQQEAEVLEQAGHYAQAADAFRSAIEAAGNDASASDRASVGLERVQSAARGTVADEPDSTHRTALDERWGPPAEPVVASVPTTAPPKPASDTDERIVTQWYFWVTVGAIVASAAAVTAIAIRAARDEPSDALDSSTRSGAFPRRGLIRF